jgi:FixJ family two-component response regulator
MGESEIMRVAPTVIVLDDDPAVRSSLEFWLTIEGYSVRAYASGMELLSDGVTVERGCLVVDYRLPEMSGLDVLAELRRRHVTLPAILITTHPVDEVRKRAQTVGAALVEKPLISERLFEEIRAACG